MMTTAIRTQRRYDQRLRNLVRTTQNDHCAVQADYEYFAGDEVVMHKGRFTQGLNLPRPVLEKFYHGNAERVLKLDAAWKGP